MHKTKETKLSKKISEAAPASMPHNVFLVGIGGIGLSALAQMLVRRGCAVSGVDRSPAPTTDMLEKQGISISYGHDAKNVPEGCELLIYSDAIPEDAPEREYARQKNIPQVSYFEALGMVSRGMRTIAVAGTKGKTTATGMLTRILREAGKNPTAIIGSIVRDFGSNFVAGRDDLFVVEACEYKDHLLKLSPEILIITNVELEHTDHFRDLEAVQYTFRRAAEAVPAHGYIITDPHHPTIAPVLREVKAKVIDYTTETVPPLHQVGEFNRENARAAKAAAKAAFTDIDGDECDTALASFQGAWRRFEFKGETPRGALVYDDYAHTPTGIRRTIEGVRERFPQKDIVVAFHPHTYSRTKSLFDDFAKALSGAEKAYVLPVFAAREKHDPTVSHHALAAAAQEYGGIVRAVDSFEELERHLLDEEGTNVLIITMGAGDVYKVAETITE